MEQTIKPSIQDVSIVDVFCGIGGLTHGFVLEGFPVAAGIDADESCRFPYEHNNNGAKFMHAEFESLTVEDIDKLYPAHGQRVLVGCAPCQPFSSYNRRTASEKQYGLIGRFADLIVQLKPEVVSMENVPRLQHFDNGSIFENFVTRLKQAGYHVTYDVLNCEEYNVPQERRRLVLLASLLGEIDLPSPTVTDPKNYLRVIDVIGDLPEISAGETCESDPLHVASRLSEVNLARIRASQPGGTWRDWPEKLVAACHRKKSGRFYGSVYGRMEYDKPAPTITTQFNGYGNGRFGHPEQDRAISLREGALLQSFDRNYKLLKQSQKATFRREAVHIGNAVPVNLARAIARTIRKHFND